MTMSPLSSFGALQALHVGEGKAFYGNACMQVRVSSQARWLRDKRHLRFVTSLIHDNGRVGRPVIGIRVTRKP